MNLQEATERIKAILNQEIAPNTLRKACATGRLRGIRKGEGSMHIRRTEWEVTEEDVIQFVREEYHPRPTRRNKKLSVVHIPKEQTLAHNQKSEDKIVEESNSEAKIVYRVIEYLFQKPLPIHGEGLEKYDTRIIKAEIRSKAKAEEIVEELRKTVQANNLADQLQYEVESYSIPNKKRKF